MNKISIIIVDDHQIVREGLCALIEQCSDMEVMLSVGSGEELLRELKTKKPDLVLLDLSMPEMSGIDVLKIIGSEFPDIKVLVLSMNINEQYIFNALKFGAKGYLSKTSNKEEIVGAIKTINSGGEYLGESISKIAQEAYINMAKGNSSPLEDRFKSLSKREKEVVQLILDGLTNREISEKLFLSIRTVEFHKNNIMRKLKLKSIVGLVKFSLESNLNSAD